MPEDKNWAIPTKLQPVPDDFSFDLERALRAVVGLRADIPADAFTADILGTERIGSGVVIRDDGLIATIGYLITEAETIWLTAGDGQTVPGHALAYDQETGFGLVQPLGHLALPYLELGGPDSLPIGEQVVLASGGGRAHAIATQVIARQEFAGYWEYLLDDALFIAPAHPFWGGAGLIGQDGRLQGIGSLMLQQGNDEGRRRDVNMVVPASHLVPILGDLLSFGRVNRPPRPWLGVYAVESGNAVVVTGLAEEGPAARAGVHIGDRIMAVSSEEVLNLADMWRRIWASGPAGTAVRLHVARDSATAAVTVMSADRASFLRAPRLH